MIPAESQKIPTESPLEKVPITLVFRYFFFFNSPAVTLFGNKKNTYFVQIWNAKQVFSIRFKN